MVEQGGQANKKLSPGWPVETVGGRADGAALSFLSNSSKARVRGATQWPELYCGSSPVRYLLSFAEHA